MVMKLLKKTKFKKIRKTLVSQVMGRVLEIDSDTGMNFPHYHNATHI